MEKAKKVKQLNFTMPDRVGLLSEISAAIAKAKVNILAGCAYDMEGRAYFMLITNNNAKAKKALGTFGVDVKEEDVISVDLPNKVGALQRVSKKIAEAGININYMYGTASPGKSSVIIFKTVDDKKAIKLISKK